MEDRAVHCPVVDTKVRVLCAVEVASSPGRRLLDGVKVARSSAGSGAAGHADSSLFRRARGRRARGLGGPRAGVGPPARVLSVDFERLRSKSKAIDYTAPKAARHPIICGKC